MNLEETRKYINDRLFAKLKPLVEKLYGIIVYSDYAFIEPEESYQLLKDISIISGELFGNKQNRDEFEELLKSTVVDSEQYRAKSETFRMLRNFMVHFPIFETWEEIFITKNMLRWANDKAGTIERYFSDNKGKTLEFSIYTRNDYFYKKAKEFKILIPELKASETIYLKDIVSFEDVLWMFTLVGYYLECKEWRVEPDRRYFGCISA